MFKGFTIPKFNVGNKGELLEALAVISQEKSNIAMAFGVTWKTVVSESTRKKYKKLAQQEGATHYLSREQQLCYGRLLPGDWRPGEQIYAAAKVVSAKLVNGICLLEITPTLIWVTVFRNGSPTKLDKIFHNKESAIEECKNIYSGLSSENVDISVYGNLETKFIEIKPLTVQDIFLYIDERELRLQEFPRREGIPKSVLMISGFLVVSLVGMKAFNEYQSFKRNERLLAAAENNQINHVQAWNASLDKWASEHAAPIGKRASGFRLVRDSIGNAPVEWMGWLLRGVRCIAVVNAQAAPNSNGLGRNWICSATYERNGSASALNSDLSKNIPNGWSVDYSGLNKVFASWSIKEDIQKIDVQTVVAIDYHKIELTSLFQRLKPAFEENFVFNYSPVVITTPMDEKGREIPMPNDFPSLSIASIAVKGPLRSIDAVFESDALVDWNELQIESVNPYPEGQMELNLRSSYVMAEMKGKIYAKK